MKSSSALNIGIAAVVFGLLAGCGQTGPLYLPKPPAKPAVPANAAATLPTTPPPPSSPAAQ
ncbi:LPS translocon maturation chaperone LptM [Massilia pseudoviolaceinigra]|uniref:LPS translocon maturation chaperone LptM n=1 Tax=Massilia pseudoviolaceinigra TaxID=3057165 RepID=UPI0027969446|nr:lipoprotein [Massilia sp. CCM 9206]MDQ1919913.1 lipoprotein [Massilia sp. CCM 9206]